MIPPTPRRTGLPAFLALSAVLLAARAAGAAPQEPSPPPTDPLAEPQRDDPPQEEREPVRLPEIVVTGSLGPEGVPRVPLDAIGSRDVLGPEAVRRTGARDLNDLVAYLPALSTRPYNGGEAAAPSFSIRGLPDDGLTEYVLALIDGVPANPLPYGWTALSFFPLLTEQVYAIDLIRGGHAVRYSPNTVGGVLNLITRPIPHALEVGVQATYGSNDYASTLLSYADGRALGGDGGFGFLATVGDRRGDGYRDEGGFDQQTADLKLRWEHDRERWDALHLSFMTDTHQAPGGLTAAQFAADRFGNARPRNRFDGFRWVVDWVRHADTDAGHVEAFAWASQTRRELDAQRPHFGAPTELLRWTDDAYVAAGGLRGERTLAGGDHTLYWGLRVQQEHIPSWEITTEPFAGGPAVPTQDAEYTLTALSAHVDDTFSPVEDVTVTAGVRAEWVPVADGEDDVRGGDFDEELFDLLPAAGASWAVREDWALFASWQRSFRAPQVWGFDVTAAAADQDVGFERGESFEVGTRAEAAGGLSGSVAWWRTDFDDVGVFYSGTYETVGRIVGEGADVVVGWQAGEALEALDGFSAWLSWTTQDSELREGPNAGNETPYAWEQKLAWSLQLETDAAWRWSLGGTYVGDSYSDEANTAAENPDGNLGRNPSRTLWDLQVEKGWTVERRRLSLALGVTNLFDEDWFVHSRGGFFGGGKVAGPPRRLYVRLRGTF